MSNSNYVALVAAGLLSVLTFPLAALRLSRAEHAASVSDGDAPMVPRRS